MELGEGQKRCSKCQSVFSLNEFYRKGSRLDSRCKSCIKSIRQAKYRRKTTTPRARITKVNVIYVQPEDPERFRRDMEIVETIFENLIYKVLSKRLKAEKK